MRGFSLKLLDLTADAGSSDTGITAGTHVVPQSQHHLLDLHTHTKKLLFNKTYSNFCLYAVYRDKVEFTPFPSHKHSLEVLNKTKFNYYNITLTIINGIGQHTGYFEL